MAEKIEILGLLSKELEAIVAGMGHEFFRARQIFGWIYRKRAASFDEMSNISKDLRAEFAGRFTLNGITETLHVESPDGARKFVLTLSDGLIIESVLMPNSRGQGWTACVSTQVGCPMDCKFCMTGKVGFFRNLKTAEIIGQVMTMARSLPREERLSNVVFMGMGEPLLNYSNLIKAIKILTAGGGLQISPRKITVSTVGIPHAMEKLGREAGVNLAVSLSATDNTVRDRIIPINRKFPLEMVLKACRKYPLKKMLTIEYVLLKGVNDTLKDARTLTRLLRGLWCKVNLIPYNPVPGMPFERPDEGRVHAFQQVLLDAKFTAIVRKSKGGPVMAACGQLGGPMLTKKPRPRA